MVSVGSVTVDVVPDVRSFDKDLAAKLNPAAVKAGQEAGRSYSQGIQDSLKNNMPAPELPAPNHTKSDAEIDRFLADFNARMKKEYQQSGDDGGNALADGMRLSLLRNSPVIATAAAGALALGAPAVAAGAGIMLAGVAIAAEKSNAALKAAASQAGEQIKETFADAASSTVPALSAALVRVSQTVQMLSPELRDLFSSLSGPIGSVTSGLLAMVQNALPGLIRMLQNAGPVFQGVAVMLADIGTGLGKMFDLISQHGGAGGQVLAALGSIIQSLLPIIGELIGAGSELAAQILPPLASVLHLVAEAMGAIGPVLPGVGTGFTAMLVVRSLTGPLQSLAQNLAMASYSGSTFAGVAGKLSTGVSGLTAALGPLGAALTFVSLQQALESQINERWAQSLAKGGQAAAQARDEMSKTNQMGQTFGSGVLGLIGKLTGYGSIMEYAKTAGQDLAGAQQQVTDTTTAATIAQQQIVGVLEATSNAASAADSQINLLKTSLDALTGKQVSEMQAQVAVTQAVDAATKATQGQAGALVDATGAINLNTAAGAAAFTGLNNLAGADTKLIATMEQHGATTDQVAAKDAQLREQFIQTAEKMGFTAGQAHNLADQIYGIPTEHTTQINANTDAASVAIHNIQDQIDNLHGRQVTIQVLADASGPGGAAGPAAYAVPGSGNGGYAAGGYTGDGGKLTPAGLVHRGEFVFPQEAVSRLGVSFLGALAGLPGYADGGPVVNYLDINTKPFNDGIQAAANRMRDAIFASAAGAGGAAQWAGVAAQALGAEGESTSWLGLLLQRMNQESGGNPSIVNTTDSNWAAGTPSVGLMQVIGPTYQAHKDPRFDVGPYVYGTSIDPMANITAAIRYTEAAYGTLSAWGQPGGYELGTNYVPHDGMYLLHQGEAVVPASKNQQGAPYKDPPQVVQNFNGPIITQDADEFARANAKRTRRALVTYGLHR